jgi:hypothetical protein
VIVLLNWFVWSERLSPKMMKLLKSARHFLVTASSLAIVGASGAVPQAARQLARTKTPDKMDASHLVSRDDRPRVSVAPRSMGVWS